MDDESKIKLADPPAVYGFTPWAMVAGFAGRAFHGQQATATPYAGGVLEVYYCPCEECEAEVGPFFAMFSTEKSGFPGRPHFPNATAAFAFIIAILEREATAHLAC